MMLQELNNKIIACRQCSRLVAWREKVASEKRRAYRDMEYWGKPVPGFGDPLAHVFIVGLAPGAHGSNRTGRQFTGDASGEFLYRALFKAGFASQPHSISRDDGLKLNNVFIAPVCRCAPPQNKPTKIEMDNCQPFLVQEIINIDPTVFVALGKLAFERIKIILSLVDPNLKFSHLATYPLSRGRYLVCSYHPSRQNTQTGRLTKDMFEQVWNVTNELIVDNVNFTQLPELEFKNGITSK